MDDTTQENVEHGWFGILDQTKIVKTQSGGLHIYLLFDGEVPRAIDHVDIKGDAGKGYVVAPFSPGYEVTNDQEPEEISQELLEKLPVFRDEPQESELPKWKREVLLSDRPPCYELAIDDLGEDDFVDKFIVDYHRAKSHDQGMLEQVFSENYPGGNWKQALNDVETDTLLVHDVLSTSYEEGVRYEHPSFLHSSPSDSKANFMVDDGGETFRCWRHSVTGNAFHLLGVKGGFIECGEWSSGISTETWLDIFQYAKELGFDLDEVTIDCQDVMDAGYCPYRCRRPAPQI